VNRSPLRFRGFFMVVLLSSGHSVPGSRRNDCPGRSEER